MPSRPTMLGSLSLAIGFAVISTASPAEAHDDQAVPRNAPAGSRAGTNAEGFDGQIEVPAPFTRGSAFLLMGDDDCGVLHRHWLRMAQDTRDPEESASGIDTPGLPIACAKSKGVVTCKIFKDGFTAAFTAPITADTPAEFRFRTPAGYIDVSRAAPPNWKSPWDIIAHARPPSPGVAGSLISITHEDRVRDAANRVRAIAAASSARRQDDLVIDVSAQNFPRGFYNLFDALLDEGRFTLTWNNQVADKLWRIPVPVDCGCTARCTADHEFYTADCQPLIEEF